MEVVPKPELKKLLEEATSQYHRQLKDSAPHMEYLLSRGLRQEDVDSFRLGAVVDPLSVHESYYNRIVFPYITPAGVVDLRFRRFPDDIDRPKFLEMVGGIGRLYNTRALLNGDDRVYICEGETDTIMATACGLSAVGISGAHKWTRTFARVFRNRDVCVLADQDEKDDNGAGMALAKAVYKDLGGCDIKRMPRGYDVSSFVNEKGMEALLERLGS